MYRNLGSAPNVRTMARESPDWQWLQRSILTRLGLPEFETQASLFYRLFRCLSKLLALLINIQTVNIDFIIGLTRSNGKTSEVLIRLKALQR